MNLLGTVGPGFATSFFRFVKGYHDTDNTRSLCALVC